jgi:6-phosphofructokinase
MTASIKRIAINFGGGYVPGLNSVVTGVVRAAYQLNWEVVGIHDGYDGLFIPGQYADGGLITLTPSLVDILGGAGGSILGTGAQTDPFRARHVTPDGFVEERDRSDELLGLIKNADIDAVISVVGGSAVTGMHALTVALKLHRKGLRTVCIPKSAENDVPATSLAFGYNSILSHTTEMLERVRVAAHDVRRIAVVEVPGQNSGWLALQAGMAVCADVVLIPEISYDITKVAALLRERLKAGQRSALVVAAEGAVPMPESGSAVSPSGPARGAGLRGSLSPGADPLCGEGSRVIERSGQVAESLALTLQRLTDVDILPLTMGNLVRGGTATAVDRQLGLGYGVAAVRALDEDRNGVMAVFQPPDLKFVSLEDAVNKVRTVPADSLFVQTARSLGISLGDL